MMVLNLVFVRELLLAVRKFERGDACTPVEGAVRREVLRSEPKGAIIRRIDLHGGVVAPS
jgi:hypothetical protein